MRGLADIDAAHDIDGLVTVSDPAGLAGGGSTNGDERPDGAPGEERVDGARDDRVGPEGDAEADRTEPWVRCDADDCDVSAGRTGSRTVASEPDVEAGKDAAAEENRKGLDGEQSR